MAKRKGGKTDGREKNVCERRREREDKEKSRKCIYVSRAITIEMLASASAGVHISPTATSDDIRDCNASVIKHANCRSGIINRFCKRKLVLIAIKTEFFFSSHIVCKVEI